MQTKLQLKSPTIQKGTAVVAQSVNVPSAANFTFLGRKIAHAFSVAPFAFFIKVTKCFIYTSTVELTKLPFNTTY